MAFIISNFSLITASLNSCPQPQVEIPFTTRNSFLCSQSLRFQEQLHSLSRATTTTTTAYRFFSGDTQEDEEEAQGFGEAVALFNTREYYRCHDLLETIWYTSEDPTRTLIHAILQCAVGFHHLFNNNHKGAMMELGEGLCKLRKLNLESGPFLDFEKEISAVLEFIYQTQLELAACTYDFCVTLDRSQRSYQLLGGYGAGQDLYHLEIDNSGMVYIAYTPARSEGNGEKMRVKLPILQASEESLRTFAHSC